MLKVAVVGATGYTGLELTRLLLRHPMVELVAATTRKYKGTPLSSVFPELTSETDLVCEKLSIERISKISDLVFVALPHKTAMEVVPLFLKNGRKVIDLSADFRFRDISLYEKWYQKHIAPEVLKEAVYGLSEIYHEKIKNSLLVANPGCYPTGAILALAPLISSHSTSTKNIVIDAKSGASGAGRSPQLGVVYCEVNEGLKAYKVCEHRHAPEIEEHLSILAGEKVTISFTPHLIPLSRGILTTIYANLKRRVTTEELIDRYKEFYNGKRFVRVYPPNKLPNTLYVRGSNYCDIGLKVDPRGDIVIIISAIDNLTKGASGQAIQNMNLMYGFEEDVGLRQIPLSP
jgi:N-acetyl-gamma-glutamyl-phosphate reductase